LKLQAKVHQGEKNIKRKKTKNAEEHEVDVIQTEGGRTDHKSNFQAQLLLLPGNQASFLLPGIITRRSGKFRPAN
jgi:hypothetical protein